MNVILENIKVRRKIESILDEDLQHELERVAIEG